MHDLRSQDIRPQTTADLQLPLAVVMPLQLVLQVTGELLQTDPEQVLDEVARQAHTLVGVVVLVVGVLVGGGHLEHLTHDAAEEDRLLVAELLECPEVRQQLLVEQVHDSLLTVLLLLAGRELLLQPAERLFLRLDAIGLLGVRIANMVDVGDHVLERLSAGGDGGEDSFVRVDSQRSHQQHDRDHLGAGTADLDHQQTILALLHGEGLAHTVSLAEDLGHLGLARVALVHLHSDTVRSEVLHRDEDSLSPVDDEVTTRVVLILALDLQHPHVVLAVLFAGAR